MSTENSALQRPRQCSIPLRVQHEDTFAGGSQPSTPEPTKTYYPTFVPTTKSNDSPSRQFSSPAWKRDDAPSNHMPTILLRYQAMTKGEDFDVKHCLPKLKGPENIGPWAIQFLERSKKLYHLKYLMGKEPAPDDPNLGMSMVEKMDEVNTIKNYLGYTSAEYDLMEAIQDTVPSEILDQVSPEFAVTRAFEEILKICNYYDGFVQKSYLWWEFTVGTCIPLGRPLCTNARYVRKVKGRDGNIEVWVHLWAALLQNTINGVVPKNEYEKEFDMDDENATNGRLDKDNQNTINGGVDMDEDMKACAFLNALYDYDPEWVELVLGETERAAKAGEKVPGLDFFISDALTNEQERMGRGRDRMNLSSADWDDEFEPVNPHPDYVNQIVSFTEEQKKYLRDNFSN